MQGETVESRQLIHISARTQTMHCFEKGQLLWVFPVSTAKNGLGEQMGSECTPRGWHRIYSRIGLDAAVNSVFVSREWTGEIYSRELAEQFPGRDWILTRILQLEGLEPLKNSGGEVDSLARYIYIHGTPDTTQLGIPGSHGCIRVSNTDIIALADWVHVGTRVFIG